MLNGGVVSISTPNLIDQLLHQQQTLTAVEKFSQKHEHDQVPVQEKYYRDLIPLNKPGAGEQLAFEVNLDACTGCKACVVACHSLNGLDENESWRDVGLITGGTTTAPIQQTVTSACHHCADPACMNGCPTLAYEKDEETGIVRHLDDQCIGCQYCVLKCPYDVPKYNDALGIVRKCDMCYDRLKEGEAPACVQSCPSGAISIKVVRKDLAVVEPQMIASAFNSEYTKPTTTFRSKRKLPDNLIAADQQDLTPEHEHRPLVWMLTLTQIGAGLFSILTLLLFTKADTSLPALLTISFLGLAVTLLGIGSSISHLGNPKGAWRAFMGLKKSWLSREIVVFGAWPPLAILVCVMLWSDLTTLLIPTAIACSLTGLLGVFCSVMVYADTHRDFWRFDRTMARFFGTVLLGGSSISIAVMAYLDSSDPVFLWIIFGLGLVAKGGIELLSLLPVKNSEWSYAKKSALLQQGPLKQSLTTRWALLILGAILLFITPIAGSLILLTGEWFARSLFFRAVAAPKMPGNPPSPN